MKNWANLHINPKITMASNRTFNRKCHCGIKSHENLVIDSQWQNWIALPTHIIGV